jgi:AcrR family transcriptional regulator
MKTTTMSDDEGLRERKKRQTRRLLAEVATRLFAERGFDEVKVAEIAAAAAVSEKTVFNYFPTKEDLMLDGREEVESELLRTIRERPPGESILAAARRHTLSVAERMNALPAERRAAFRKVVANTPSVHARMRQMSQRYEDELTRLLAEETGSSDSDPTTRTVAGVLGVLSRIAFGFSGKADAKRWKHAGVVASIHETFDLFEHGLGRYGVRGRGKTSGGHR